MDDSRTAIKKLNLLTDAQIDKISKGDNSEINTENKSTIIEKLIIVGANCLDENANWTNRYKGRNIYNILKSYDSESLSNSMSKVVLMQIDRKKVLFLVAKLGIPGTQKPLNDLLLKYGDKWMAEDYLNSGSGELSSGGRKWAQIHGYNISSGYGSNRIEWGKF